MPVSIAVASGKGGVGKSVFTANLGVTLARLGFSVVIVDADIGLRTQDALLSLENQVVYDVVDVASKDCVLSQAVLAHPSVSGLHLLPAAQFARAKALSADRLENILQQLKRSFDYILLDCPAGIERGFRTVLKAGVDEMILVVTPDDVCIRDAEHAARILDEKQFPRPFVVVNRLDAALIHAGEMYSARTAAGVLDLDLIGEIPEDAAVSRSVLRHTFFVDYDCEARKAVLRIARRLTGSAVRLPDYGRRRPPLWRRFFPAPLKEVQPLDRH